VDVNDLRGGRAARAGEASCNQERSVGKKRPIRADRSPCDQHRTIREPAAEVLNVRVAGSNVWIVPRPTSRAFPFGSRTAFRKGHGLPMEVNVPVFGL